MTKNKNLEPQRHKDTKVSIQKTFELKDKKRFRCNLKPLNLSLCLCVFVVRFFVMYSSRY